MRKAGLTQATGRTGAVTLIQRFGRALNLNIHLHLLVLDGAYELTPEGPRFRAVSPPTAAELEALLGQIVGRIARHLERRGLVVRDAENSDLSSGPDEDTALEGLLGHSITYRIAVGPNEGRKAFALPTLAPALEAPGTDQPLAKHSGFSSTPALLPPANRATRWSGCAATSRARLQPPGGWRSPPRGWCATR